MKQKRQASDTYDKLKRIDQWRRFLGAGPERPDPPPEYLSHGAHAIY